LLLLKSTGSDIKLYRKLFLISSAAYFLFWFVLISVDSKAFDPIAGRGLVSLSILAAFTLSYTNKFFRNNIVIVAYILSYFLTFYYVFLLAKNNFSNIYSIGMMTILFGIAVVFKESISLLIYLSTCLISVGISYLFLENPEVKPFLYLSILLTTSLVAYLVMSIRLKIQEELSINNIRLEDAYREINEQKKIVDIKNHDITDSINYARKIQQAIVPSKTGLEEFLPESFIYYRVKDIVSGDFYWYHKYEDELVIAAVDCTGHGVPGALVSMISVSLLKQTVDIQGIHQPDKILANLQKEITSFLHRGSNDGMDIALCSVNLNKMTLSFAGAMLRIIMIRDGVAKEIKGDRFPISRNTAMNTIFTNHTISLKKGDAFYMFTDGYYDQFGGTKHKKFMYKNLEKLFLSIYDLDMQEQKSIIENTHKNWKGELEQVDDILVIGFKA
jgi:serine phosphatase RsbU (regulator of sigma subunit)